MRTYIKKPVPARPNGHAGRCNCFRCRDTDLDGLPKWSKPLLKQACRNAGKRGIPFDLASSDYAEIVNRCAGHCEVSGIPLENDLPNGKRRPFAPSLDRINSSLGYTRENCRIVCVIVNLALNEWGVEPLLVVARSLVAREKEILRNEPSSMQTVRSFCASNKLHFIRSEFLAFQSRCNGIRRSQGVKSRWAPSGDSRDRMVRAYPLSVLEAALDQMISASVIRPG